MPSNDLLKRYLTELLIIVYFMILVVLSAIFYKEFALTLDGPMIILEILGRKLHSFGPNRWGSWPTQILSYGARSQGASLEWIIRLVAVSSFVLPFILYLIARVTMKDKGLSTLLAITPILGMTDVFLHRQWPLLIGISYTAFFAVLMSFSYKVKRRAFLAAIYTFGLLVLYVVVNTHFSLLICLAFIVVFNLFYFTQYKQRCVAWLATLLAAIAIKALSYEPSHYEAYKYLSIIYYLLNFRETMVDPKTFFFFKSVAELNFILPQIFAIVALLALYKKRKKWAFRFFVAAMIGGLLLYNGLLTSVPYERSNLYYFQGSFLPYIFILSYPFFLMLDDVLASRGRQALFTGVVLIFCLAPVIFRTLPEKYRLNEALTVYCNELRVNPERMFVKLFDQEKFGDVCYYFFNEKTLVLTSIQDADSALSIFFTNDTTNYGADTMQKYLIRADGWNIEFDSADDYSFIRDYYPHYFFNSLQSDYVRLRSTEVKVLH